MICRPFISRELGDTYILDAFFRLAHSPCEVSATVDITAVELRISLKYGALDITMTTQELTDGAFVINTPSVYIKAIPADDRDIHISAAVVNPTIVQFIGNAAAAHNITVKTAGGFRWSITNTLVVLSVDPDYQESGGSVDTTGIYAINGATPDSYGNLNITSKTKELQISVHPVTLT